MIEQRETETILKKTRKPTAGTPKIDGWYMCFSVRAIPAVGWLFSGHEWSKVQTPRIKIFKENTLLGSLETEFFSKQHGW